MGREGEMESERGKKVGGEKQQQGVEKRVMGRRNEGVKKGKERRGRREGEGRNVVQLYFFVRTKTLLETIDIE